MELEKREKKKYRWHKKFAYQKFKGWRPILTPHHAELFFVACGVLLIALGVPILIASLNVVEYKVPYAFEGVMAGKDGAERQQLLWDSAGSGVTYDVSIAVKKRMEPPIYVVFELGTYFQNFRRYVRSYDPVQMHDGGNSPLAACAPFQYLTNPDGSNDNSAAITPCGQIAHSFFNDSYSLAIRGGAPLAVDDSSIAWPSDRDNLYGPVTAKNYNPGGAFESQRGGNTSELLLNQNEHWMVWMRPHSMVAVQKLYGRIDTPIEAGQEVVVTVTNRYNTYEYNGAKSIILTTNSWVGGKNVFLGACYLATGGLCLLLVLFFIFGYDIGWLGKRRYGDMANLSWLKEHAKELSQQQQFMAAGSGGFESGGSGNGTVQMPQDGSLQEDGVAAVSGTSGQPPKN